MYLLNRNDNPICKADLTKRMRLHIGITDSLPGPSISTVYSRVPVVLLVAGVFLFLMLLTIASIRQVWAARDGTGLLWFSWHSCPPSSGHEKAPGGVGLSKLHSFLLIILYHKCNLDICGQTRRFYKTVGSLGTLMWERALLCQRRTVLSSTYSRSPIWDQDMFFR